MHSRRRGGARWPSRREPMKKDPAFSLRNLIGAFAEARPQVVTRLGLGLSRANFDFSPPARGMCLLHVACAPCLGSAAVGRWAPRRSTGRQTRGRARALRHAACPPHGRRGHDRMHARACTRTCTRTHARSRTCTRTHVVHTVSPARTRRFSALKQCVQPKWRSSHVGICLLTICPSLRFVC